MVPPEPTHYRIFERARWRCRWLRAHRWHWTVLTTGPARMALPVCTRCARGGQVRIVISPPEAGQ